MASESFKVRRLTTPEEVYDLVYSKTIDRGWKLGTLDHVSYYAADKTGFFVGELNGNPINCVSFIKHTTDFAYGGPYLEDEQYQGKGYGLKMWNIAKASLNENVNLAGDPSIDMMPMYTKLLNFKSMWFQQCFDFVVESHFLSKFDRPKEIEIIPASKLLFTALLDYDTHVHV